MLYEPIRGTFEFEQNSKRFRRYRVITNTGIVGSIYVPKTAESVPDTIILKHTGKPNEVSGRQLEQIEAVVNVLFELDGEVESQTDLKKAVVDKIGISEATARRIIKQACTMKKIIAIPKIGKGNPFGYKLPFESKESEKFIINDTKEEEKCMIQN